MLWDVSPCWVVSLQAVCAWVSALSPGGVASIIFWPPNREQNSPWARFTQVCAPSTAETGILYLEVVKGVEYQTEVNPRGVSPPSTTLSSTHASRAVLNTVLALGTGQQQSIEHLAALWQSTGICVIWCTACAIGPREMRMECRVHRHCRSDRPCVLSYGFEAPSKRDIDDRSKPSPKHLSLQPRYVPPVLACESQRAQAVLT